MKRLFAAILVLALALSTCVMLASCSEISEKDIEENPSGTVSDAFDNTMKQFFDGGIGLYDVLNKASDKSSLQVYFESEDLLGEDLTRIGATVYSDIAKNNYVLEAEATYKDDKLSATAFINKDGVIVSGESVFDSNEAYGLYFDSFINKFKGSDLSAMMGFDEETAQQIVDVVKAIKETMNKKATDAKSDYEELIKDLCEIFDQTVTTENVTVGGEEVECIVTKYDVNNKTLKSAIKKIYTDGLAELDQSGELEASIEAFLETLEDEYDIDIEISISLIKSKNTIANICIAGDATHSYEYTDYIWDDESFEYSTDTVTETYTTELEVNVDFSDTAIEITAVVDDGEEKTKAEITIEKAVESGNVSYTIEVLAKQGSATVDVASIELLFEKNGDFEINATIMEDEINSAPIKIKGTYKTEKNKASFEIESVKYGNTTLQFVLGIVIDADPSIPSTPSNVNDVIDLDEEEWAELGEAVMGSDLGQFIMDLFGYY